MKYCRKCGNQLKNEAKFCGFCGTENIETFKQEIIREEIIEIKDEKIESKTSDTVVLSIVLGTIGFNILLIFVFSYLI